MVNQSVIDSSVNLEQLKDIEDLIPDMDKAISEKVETFLDKSGDQPYAHMNEGYVVIVWRLLTKKESILLSNPEVRCGTTRRSIIVMRTE